MDRIATGIFYVAYFRGIIGVGYTAGEAIKNCLELEAIRSYKII